ITLRMPEFADSQPPRRLKAASVMHHTLRTQDLELAIDDVVESYDGPQEINNLESAALPNKRAVIEAYNHIKPVIYLGFYSLRSLHRENLRFAVSEHLYPAFETLVE